jgi:hypothetical protein
MKLDTSVFRSRVAARIFALFGICALLPITAQAILSFNEVTSHLQAQTRIRLQQSVKSLGMAVLERLLLYDAVLEGIAMDLRTGSFVPAKNQVQEVGEAALLTKSTLKQAIARCSRSGRRSARPAPHASAPRLASDRSESLPNRPQRN